MKRIAKNTFEQGVVMDVNSYDAPTNAATNAHNIRIKRAGKNFVVETESGNAKVGQLKEGYLPLAAMSMAGVAYILSHNPTSLKSELGTYPSPPASGNGRLVKEYKPLQNFSPSGLEADLGDFNTMDFGFSLQNPVTMKLQPSYDGTVNIILTDGENPAYLVNSGLRVTGMNVGIIRRSGREANWYKPADFDSTLQMIQKSERLLGVGFGGVAPGGKLPAGTWRAYFKYATFDYNETEVLAESFSIPVGFGATPATTRGGTTNEPTDKRILFSLSNIDTSFAYLKVYLAYTSGDVEPVTTVYGMLNAYPINADTMELSITGFEQMAPVNAQELSLSFANIQSFKTMEQTHNRLFPANVKTKIRDYSFLERFARKVLIGHKEKQLKVPSTIDAYFLENSLNSTDSAEGYGSGYTNPNNVYHYTGFWGGEANPFAMQFIFDDGSLSPAFACTGLDNVDGDKIYSARDAAFSSQVAAMLSQDGWDTVGGLNSRGVYRFPNRNTAGATNLLENGRITVNGVTFQFPSLSDADFAEIKRQTIGVQFLVGERKPDVVTQGYLIPTLTALIAEKQDGYDHLDGAFNDIDNIKYIPALLGGLEAVAHQDTNRDWHAGFYPFYFPDKITPTSPIPFSPDYQFAFYSSDAIADEAKYGSMLNADYQRQIKVLHNAVMKAELPVKTSYTHAGATHQFTLASAYATYKENLVLTGKTSFMPGSSPLLNQHRFSSATTWYQGRNHRNWFRLAHSFNSFGGVKLDGRLDVQRLLYQKPTPFNSEVTGQQVAVPGNKIHQVAYNANIYNGAQLDRVQLASRHNSLVGVAFRPISQRLYWDETHPMANRTNTLSSKLDEQGKITLFGGDCFINLTMRRISINNHDDKSDTSEAFKQNVGYTLQVCNEGNTNAAFRTTELFDVNEKFKYGYDRSFLPYFATRATYNSDNNLTNSFRTNRLGESKGYSPGYGHTRSEKQYLPFLQNVPHVETVFDNRVYYSEQHLNNAFANGFRNIMLSAFQDYPKHLGGITRLVTLNGALFMVTDHSVSIISVNERVTAANDSAGPIFIAPSAVLSPLLGSITEEFGSRYPFSVVASDNFIYGIDTDNNCIWRCHNGRQLELISDNFVRELLESFTGVFSETSPEMLLHDVRSYYHKDKKDVIFVFYYKVEASEDAYSNPYTYTLVYNEESNLWMGTRGFSPVLMFSIGDQLYSFNVKKNSNELYEHFVATDQELPNHATFYGEAQESFFEFIVSGETEGEKLFDTVRLISNNVLPVRLEMGNDLGRFSQKVNASKDIFRNNTTISGEEIIIILKKQEGARLRDKYLKVRVVYKTTDKALISSINTVLRNF